MNLEGSYTFDAPRDVVWESLMNPDVLARVLPGCEKLEEVGENEYQAVLKIRVGPVQGKFQGSVTLTDVQAPDSYHITIDGQGAPGFMKGTGHVNLEDQNGSTILHYSGEGQVGGRIAQVGQRLLDSSAKALTRQSLDGLNKQVQARLQPKAGPATAEPAADIPAQAEAPSEFEFAMGVAKNMIEEMVPPERRPMAIAVGVGLVALWLFLNWWGTMIARAAAREAVRRR